MPPPDLRLELDLKLTFWARTTPAKPALARSDGPAISYAELDKVTREWGGEFHRLNLASEDLVAIFTPHGVPQAVAIISLLRAGIKGVVLDSQLTPSILRENLDRLPLSAVIGTGPSFSVLAREAGWGLSTLSEKTGDSLLYLAKISSPSLPAIDREAAWVMLTSGSTGQPKAVLQSGWELIHRACSEQHYFQVAPNDISLCSLLLSHDVAFCQVLANLMAGATLLVQPFVFPTTVLRVLRDFRCTKVWGSPYLWKNLMRLCAPGEPLSNEVRFATVSGGSLSESDFAELAARLPRAEIVRTYGQTETFRTFLARDHLPGFNELAPGVKIRLIDDRGETVSSGTRGQLVHSGAGVMIGYYPRAQTEAQLAEIETGDEFIEQNGRFIFLGRRDGMLKRFDTRFYPREIEAVIERCKLVDDCVVTLIPEAESLHAFVVLKQPSPVAEQKVEAYCRHHLTFQRRPSRISFVEHLPRLANGKVDLKLLEQLSK